MEDTIVMAEREEAIADGLDHPEYCGGVIEVAKGLWYSRDEIDLEQLIANSRRLGNRSAFKRLAFWVEQLSIVNERTLEQLVGADDMQGDRDYPLLDPTGPAQGVRNARWRLVANIPEQQLLEWRKR